MSIKTTKAPASSGKAPVKPAAKAPATKTPPKTTAKAIAKTVTKTVQKKAAPKPPAKTKPVVAEKIVVKQEVVVDEITIAPETQQRQKEMADDLRDIFDQARKAVDVDVPTTSREKDVEDTLPWDDASVSLVHTQKVTSYVKEAVNPPRHVQPSGSVSFSEIFRTEKKAEERPRSNIDLLRKFL